MRSSSKQDVDTGTQADSDAAISEDDRKPSGRGGGALSPESDVDERSAGESQGDT